MRAAPRAGRDGAAGVVHDADGRPRLKLKVSAPPADGAANAAIRKLVAKALGRPPGAVAIIRGETSREKTLRIEGDPDALRRAAAEWIGASAP